MPEPDIEFIKVFYANLLEEFGKPDTPLNYKHPYELAIAVILSAQCTDEQVNKVTPLLFVEFNKLSDFYKKPLNELQKMIYSTGFYKNKAKNIREFARLLDENHGGQLPRNIKELTALPGIGRKTANVILNEHFGIVEGIVVDTHVVRIMRLFGFTNKKNAVQIERDLMQIIPQKYWRFWSLLVIFLGRKYCGARKQLCTECCLNKICPAVIKTIVNP